MITTQKGFVGIDQRKKLSDGIRTSTDMTNFKVTDSGSLERRASIIERFRFAGDVDGIWSGMLYGKETVAVVASGKLYAVDPTVESGDIRLIGNACYGKCRIFEFNGALYIKSKSYYGKYDGTSIGPVEGYVPCVALSCTPNGEGQPFEQINLLTDKRRQLFSSDGQSDTYVLAEEGVYAVVSVKINGNDYSGEYTLENGHRVKFVSPPEAGLNNVEITYSKATAQTDRDRIMNCTNVMLFGGNSDGRAFLWGNEDLPNHRFHSDLANGVPSVEYFPVNAFTVIGNSKINCIVQQYDKQLIFTKNEAYYSYSELRDDGIGNVVTSFPVFSLNGSKGCLIETEGCVIDNRPVTLCDDGFNMWESTSIENERNAICFSSQINEFLNGLSLAEKENIRIFDFQAHREFYCVVNGKAFVFNYGNGAWYCFDEFKGGIFSVCGSKLYFANENSVFNFADTNNKRKIVCNLESPFITNATDRGNCDVTLLEADIFVEGETTVTVEFEKSNGDKKTRRFYYHNGTSRFFRIAVRPSLKGAMPFRIRMNIESHGQFALHGITIKTRDKERSKKYGIL
jgi:hypothetical protein